jgi:hypothetical protein
MRTILWLENLKRPPGRRKRRGEDNIRMDLRKIRWEVMNWIYLDQDKDIWWAAVNMVMKLRVL